MTRALGEDVEHDKKGHEDGHIYRAWELEGNGECPLMGTGFFWGNGKVLNGIVMIIMNSGLLKTTEWHTLNA